MMEEKINTKKSVDVEKKIKDLKIELLKNPMKRGRIKKEIARLLTMARNDVLPKKGTKVPTSLDKNLTKSEDKA